MANPVDDIWKSLKDGEIKAQNEYRVRSKAMNSGVNGGILDIMNKANISSKDKAKKSKPKKLTRPTSSIVESSPENPNIEDLNIETVKSNDDENPGSKTIQDKTIISYADMIQKINRYLNGSESENSSERKRSLLKLHSLICYEHSMTTSDYSETFSDVSKFLFKRYSDNVEKCRELALRITIHFCSHAADFTQVLAYYMPALTQRVSASIAYDEEMQVFVTDMEAHEAYRRGRAINRQDKGGTANILSHTVVESSEEIRLLTCRTLTVLIDRLIHLQAMSVLQPYFNDAVLFLQSQLRDPYPELKIEAASNIEKLCHVGEYEIGMKYFAVALIRALLPQLRHRLARVRVVVVDAVSRVIQVRDREKRKGAGSNAIVDLVGFREENVLQVASFYQSDVTINYIAELVIDSNVSVREHVANMLFELLTELEDRYDHQQRLLPYLLDLMTDENTVVSNIAWKCLVKCGEQYEAEHPDDIIEKRQYGIDGDTNRINLEKPLPHPFTVRPRIGMRLYVRGNTKRFLWALVNELTNWQSKTRLKSAQLLKVIIVLCEEFLTMECHKLLPLYVKALKCAKDDKDKNLEQVLMDIFELSGRYIAPETYLHYLLPRVRGDVEVYTMGIDNHVRNTIMEILNQYLEGTKSKLLLEHLSEIVDILTDPYIIDSDSIMLQTSAINVVFTFLRKFKGNATSMTEGYFQSTGRLPSFRNLIYKLFKFLLLALNTLSLNSMASDCLSLLGTLDTDTSVHGVKGLCDKYIAIVVQDLITACIIDDSTNSNDNHNSTSNSHQAQFKTIYDPKSSEFILLSQIVSYPEPVLYMKPQFQGHLRNVFQYLLFAIKTVHSDIIVSHDGNANNVMYSDDSGVEHTKIHIEGTSSLLSSSHDQNLLILTKHSELLYQMMMPLSHLNGNDEAQPAIVHSNYRNMVNMGILTADIPYPSFSNIPNNNIFREMFHDFISVCTMHELWNGTTTLQTTRLNIFQVIVDVISNSSQNDTSTIEEKDKISLLSILASLLPTLCTSLFYQLSQPAISLKIRLFNATLLNDTMSLFYDENVKAIPYSDRRISTGSDDIYSEHLLTAYKGYDISKAASLLLRIIIPHMLHDSNTSIRTAALNTQLLLIHYIEPPLSEALDGISPTKNAVKNIKEDFNSLDKIINKLLFYVENEFFDTCGLDLSGKDELLSVLDNSLRVLCCLDINYSKSVVQEKMVYRKEKNSEVKLEQQEVDVINFYNNILDHCEMLAMFRSHKTSSS